MVLMFSFCISEVRVYLNTASTESNFLTLTLHVLQFYKLLLHAVVYVGGI